MSYDSHEDNKPMSVAEILVLLSMGVLFLGLLVIGIFRCFYNG